MLQTFMLPAVTSPGQPWEPTTAALAHLGQVTWQTLGKQSASVCNKYAGIAA
jgi:hypothetical protein